MILWIIITWLIAAFAFCLGWGLRAAMFDHQRLLMTDMGYYMGLGKTKHEN